MTLEIQSPTQASPRRGSDVMRPLRYSINITLDGCCDHRVGIADEELHRHAAENIAQADALLFGRVTYQMMESAWRLATRTAAMPISGWLKLVKVSRSKRTEGRDVSRLYRPAAYQCRKV